MKKTITLLTIVLSLSTLGAQTLNFINKANMPIARGGTASASDGVDSYICNGFSPDLNFGRTINKYNFETDTWSVFPTSIGGRRYGNAEILENNLYLFNGESFYENTTRRFEIIDLATGVLTTNPITNPNPVSRAGSAIWDNSFLVFGGCINKTNGLYSNKLYRLFPSGVWQQLANMPIAMETKGKVVVGNGTDSKLYTFGGYSETVSFGENFENIGVVSDILTSPYWENFNEVGTKLYRCVQYNYNRYAQISAYSTVLEEQEPTNISWLVSREIMVNSTDDKFLSFDTADGYNTGAVLEVYLITGYNGDINTCTKTLLNANISNAGPIDGYSNVFINSGLIPLAGNFNYFRIGFKYIGGYAPQQKSTIFQIDNVRIFKSVTSNAIQIYDIATNTWSTSNASLPQPISACAVASDSTNNGEKIYVAGDYDDQTFLGVYDTTADTFTTINQTNMIGRRNHSSEIWNNKLYLFGGNTTSSVSSSISSTQSADLTILSSDSFISNENASFYPNPSSDKIHVHEDLISVAIYSMDGKKLDTQLLNNEINISNFCSGIYVFKGVTTSGKTISKKLIKK